MDLWMIFSIVGVLCIILEMVVPSMFFLNLAVAGFLTAIVSLYVSNITALVIIYTIFSVLSIAFLRPVLIRNKESQEQKTGMEGKYIGKIVKVISPITQNSGAISIYDERWEARVESEEEIPEGAEVKIVRNDSLVMFVEKI